MESNAILKIPESEPERLFKQPDNLEQQYRALQKQWHPDINKDPLATKVFAHIGVLYDKAVEKVASKIWAPPGLLSLTGTDGRVRKITYRTRKPFELGEVFIGNTIITYVIARTHENLVLAGLRCIGTIRYPDEDFRRNLEPYFPKVEHYFETKDFIVVCMRKRKDEILLSDLIKHLGGKIDPKHTAWILSSLFNLCSFLQVTKMCVNAITPDTVFVSTPKHSVSILGGWWYAAEFDKPITTLPPDTYKLAPRKLLAIKKATPFLDLECVRNIGRTCLGDATGNSFRMSKDLPAPMTSFLQLPSSQSAIDDYTAWMKILEASFGKRRFHKLEITGDDIYQQENV